ncbi:MAG: hypothetical protein EZS28_005548 [Streblomastix strix]|uniref:Uncharacterized protein n=1 Tax=Streblomastix strix TaxID=222440 RepID=A0A5J4WVB6_9EUKA|nr:MAG: hypothetical protein EZS28_005548 [Streblomastix strix]
MSKTNALLASLGPAASMVVKGISADDISCCGRYLSMKAISEVLAPQTAVPYVMPVGFTVSIPLDDLFIFSAFSEYPNNLIGDLKIKFKINQNAFVFCQIDPIISQTKFYTICKDELMSSGQDRLKDIDLFFRNWSLIYQYTNMFTQVGCTADLITGIRAEVLTPSGLKNLICDVNPVTVSVRNYIIEAVTANMCGYKASESCLNRLIEYWAFQSAATLTELRTSQIYPLSHVTDMCLIFPKDHRCITCFEIPCYQNMQVTTLGRNFPDFPMNILNEQFFTMQLAANNLDNIFEVLDEYEDSIATPKGIATRRYNPNTDITSFFIILQCELNSNGALTFDGFDAQNQNISVELREMPIYQGAVDTYCNVYTNGNHPSPPVLCTVHEIFWLFCIADGGSCNYDTKHSFDEVVGQVIT